MISPKMHKLVRLRIRGMQECLLVSGLQGNAHHTSPVTQWSVDIESHGTQWAQHKLVSGTLCGHWWYYPLPPLHWLCLC